MRHDPHSLDQVIEPWLQEAKAGSQDALGKVLEAFRGYFRATLPARISPELRAKISPSDVAQQVFLDAYRKFDRFEGAGAQEFTAWLLRICETHLLDFQRFYGRQRRQVRREVSLADAEESGRQGRIVRRQPSPEEEVLKTERCAMIRQLVQELPKEKREFWELCVELDRDFETIGSSIGCTPESARKALFRLMREITARMTSLEVSSSL